MKWHHWNKWSRSLTAVSGHSLSVQSSLKDNWAADQTHHIWWAAWRLQTPISFFCEVMEAPASPGHLLLCFVLWSSFCCSWSLKVQPSIYLGFSFKLLRWFCIHLSLEFILSECSFMYFRCLQTTTGVTEMQTADCTVSVCIFVPCCWLLLVFVLVLNVFLLLWFTLSCFVPII